MTGLSCEMVSSQQPSCVVGREFGLEAVKVFLVLRLGSSGVRAGFVSCFPCLQLNELGPFSEVPPFSVSHPKTGLKNLPIGLWGELN